MTARFFGFWLPVHDAKTAEAAIRMAGLPVFLLGLCLVAGQFGRFAIALGGRNLAPLLSVGLIVLAFRLRAGGTALAPLATGLGVAIFAVQAAYVGMMVDAVGYGAVSVAIGLAQLIVPAFAVALPLGGLRGWIWLRRHGVARGF